MKIKPLQGVRVLDLTRLLPGAMCTLHLADMGARVIKIEERETGDYAREFPPIQKTNSTFFLATNRNKQSITLDLKKEEGREIFLRLSHTADVIVESFRPGVVKRLNIDYETVREINPKIVYCSISGFGQTGPYKERAGHDLNYCSYAAIIRQSSQDKQPSIPNFQIADIVGGSLNAVMGILAALVYQRTTGQGQYIDVSILDGVLAHCVSALSNLHDGDDKDSFTHMLTGGLPCYNVYETKDGKFIAVSALEFKFWKSFCEAIGREDLVSGHMLPDHDKKIYGELQTIFKTRTLAAWTEHFRDVDCCVSPVLTLEEAMSNEQVQAREMVLSEEHPYEGKVLQFGLPLKFSSFEFKVEKPAPMLGEHTEEVLTSIGYTKEEIRDFKEKKVV